MKNQLEASLTVIMSEFEQKNKPRIKCGKQYKNKEERNT